MAANPRGLLLPPRWQQDYKVTQSQEDNFPSSWLLMEIKQFISTDGHKTVVNKENGTAVTVDGHKTIGKKPKCNSIL